MNFKNIFNPTELNDKEGTDLQQTAIEIKQRFDQRRQRYNLIKNSLVLNDSWDELNQELIKFEKNNFQTWNKKWNNVHRQNNLQIYKNFFQEGEELFKNFDEYISNVPIQQSHSEEVEALKADMLSHIETDLLEMKTHLTRQIESGINDLIGLKAELGLTKNYKENISDELEKSNRHQKNFMIVFIASLIIIPAFLFSTFYFDFFTVMEYKELMLIRIASTVPLALLSYFFYTQYRLYQLISLKYTHLNGFLGGGATFIAQLIDSEDDVKKDINKKLAELFMELDDISSLIKKGKHPIESVLKNEKNIFEQ
ncbi:MAG: hypothetical protein ACQESP_12880 [Candidatus Muiribacteriota bacterium]